MNSHTEKQKWKLQYLHKIHDKRKCNPSMHDFILTAANGSWCWQVIYSSIMCSRSESPDSA